LTEEWTPIRREGAPEVQGVASSDRLDVRIPLNDHPENEWSRYLISVFESRQSDQGEFPLPDVVGQAIRITPRDSDLESWVKNVDEVIEQTNQYYEGTVLAQRRAADERQDRAEEERDRRIEEARRRVKDL
jgi:hypothetical protein